MSVRISVTWYHSVAGIFISKMDLDQLLWFRYIQIYSFILSQRGNLVIIHLVAVFNVTFSVIVS